MIRHLTLGASATAILVIGFALTIGLGASAADPDAAPPETASPDQPPLRGLYITGGGWHDYEAQQDILTEGLAERIRVEWEIDHTAGTASDIVIDRFRRDNWADGFDVIVYNKCHTGVNDSEIVESVVAVHRDAGVPAVFLHCAIHSFRAPTDEWFRLGGVTSHRHENHRPFHVEPLEPDHPVMIGFPDGGWTTPRGELYEIEHVWDTATPLAHAYGEDTDNHHVTIWTNHYGNARVFGTTIGHHNETMADPVYLDLVSRGLLWTVEKLQDDGTALSGYAN